MPDANMLCPKCRTYQPRAETCRECGVVVAKLWTRDEPAEPESRTPDPPGAGKTPTRVLTGLVLGAGIALAVWFALRDGAPDSGTPSKEPGMQSWIEAARDAQHAADLARERMEEAALAAEMGTPIGRTGPRDVADVVDFGLDPNRLAAEINAVAEVTAVDVRPEDLSSALSRCIRYPDRYFKALRFGAAETYPLPPPATQPAAPGDLGGRYRCEGHQGTVYSDSRPRSREGLSACWRRHKPARVRTLRGSDDTPAQERWIRMQWDDEAGRWSVYTRADQRTVDRARLADARASVAADIARLHRDREEQALRRIPDLLAAVAGHRESLAIASADSTRREHTRALHASERELREAVVERRYTWLCTRAARAALDARAAELGAGN